MGDIIEFEDRETRSIRQEASSFVESIEEMTEEEFDRRSLEIIEKWNIKKASLEEQYNEGGDGMEKLFTVEQVAEYLNISKFTVKDFLRKNIIEGIKVGREWRVEESALQRYIDSLKNKAKK